MMICLVQITTIMPIKLIWLGLVMWLANHASVGPCWFTAAYVVSGFSVLNPSQNTQLC